MARPESPSSTYINEFELKPDSLPNGIQTPTARELVLRNERTERAETLPLSSVVTDYSLVDENHATELGDSMAQDRGQISPIVVRSRLDGDSNVVYDVIDGYHRTEGQRQRGAETIKAIVVYGCSDEEMYDLRILAASSVKSVQFPRIAEWITRSYEQTKWKQKGVSVLQAFSIANNDRDSSYRVKSREELTELKDWIKDKCKSWQKSPSHVLNILKIVDVADPELVKQVRVSGGGKDREARVTPQRIQKIAMAFPKNYPVQGVVMNASIENRMSADETALLVEIIKPKLEQVSSQEHLYEIIETSVVEVNRRGLEKRNREKAIEADFLSIEEDEEIINVANEKPTQNKVPNKNRLTYKELDDLADQIAKEALEREAAGEILDDEDLHSGFADSGEYVRPSYSVFDGETARTHERRGVNVDGQMDIEELKQDRDRLRSILESRNSKTVGWWVTATYVSLEEKTILTDLFTDGKSFESVCQERKLLQKQVESLIRSALLRRQIFLARQETPISSV